MNQFKAWARCRQGAMAVALSALFVASSVAAFQVLPKVSDVDRKISSLGSTPVLDYVGHWFVGTAIPIMKSPVHESITLAALECRADRGSEYNCVTVDAVREHRILLYGVRWPDDPAFLLNPKSSGRAITCCTARTTETCGSCMRWAPTTGKPRAKRWTA